ncbi:hypothetical protein CNMCM6457_005990 [Aspergillus fumigatiaffinis]|nr:hypothetical protein CNMCM6457_005990 [Aspergillus fumigatiaffinis]
MIGDMLHARYHIVDKLGFGGYSTIWLARDTRQEQYVAVKVGIADATLPRETKILRALSSSSVHPGRKAIPVPLDEFEVNGPNGTHTCYTMAPARCNLREEEYGEPETVTITERDGKPLPPNIPKKAVIPLYLGKDAEEFSLSDACVLLGDFGEAFTPEEFRCGKDCHTPLAARPPEARFEPQAPLSYSDIWSLATAIWEILGMKAILSSDFATADEVVAQQIDVLGAMPLSWWKRWEERSQFFDDDGRPKEGRYVWPPIDKAFEEGVQEYRRKSSRVTPLPLGSPWSLKDCLGAPVANNDQVESASGELEKRFLYRHYTPEKRDEDLEKRFFYKYDPEKRDE